MSFQPVIPMSGLAGWHFLQRTYDAQLAAFSNSPQLLRDSEYFTETIGTIKSAADLVADRRLLGVALGAFNLQDDLDNRAFIQRVLEDGTSSSDALANKLADERYKRLSIAFGFGPGDTVMTTDTAKMANIVEQQKIQAFEISVGEQDNTMRIALNAQGELERLAAKTVSDDSKWFSLMALPPLRSMFETALGLPSTFGAIDIDLQLQVFRDRTQAATGDASLSQFANSDAREEMTRLFLARSQIANLGSANSASANALVLLQASTR